MKIDKKKIEVIKKKKVNAHKKRKNQNDKEIAAKLIFTKQLPTLKEKIHSKTISLKRNTQPV